MGWASGAIYSSKCFLLETPPTYGCMNHIGSKQIRQINRRWKPVQRSALATVASSADAGRDTDARQWAASGHVRPSALVTVPVQRTLYETLTPASQLRQVMSGQVPWPRCQFSGRCTRH